MDPISHQALIFEMDYLAYLDSNSFPGFVFLNSGGLDRDPPILVTGVVGGTLDREIGLSAPGVLTRIPFDDGTFFSNAITFADKICNRENTLLTTR